MDNKSLLSVIVVILLGVFTILVVLTKSDQAFMATMNSGFGMMTDNNDDYEKISSLNNNG